MTERVVIIRLSKQPFCNGRFQVCFDSLIYVTQESAEVPAAEGASTHNRSGPLTATDFVAYLTAINTLERLF